MKDAKWLKKLGEWKDDLLHLIYPSLCLVCDQELTSQEQEVCFFCEEELHYTHFEKFSEASALDKLFWGRVPLESTYALLFFQKNSSSQEILHHIKYKNKQRFAKMMGQKIGTKWKLKPEVATIDGLIPVPLHPKKEFIRGYNQSLLLSEGISESTGIPVLTDFLSRVQHSESQTKKSKFLRWDSIQSAFQVKETSQQYVHLALVDDVITTGSTLETIIKQIQTSYPQTKISIVSLALTH